jgi:hypothetical protein
MCYRCDQCSLEFQQKKSLDYHNQFCINYQLYTKHHYYIDNNTIEDIRLLFDALQIIEYPNYCNRQTIIDYINEYSLHNHNLIIKITSILNYNPTLSYKYSINERIDIIEHILHIDRNIISNVITIIEDSIMYIHNHLFKKI